METEWKVLQRAVRNLSERCAAADPSNSALYRQEADQFCGMLPPTTAEELSCLRADAELLRKRWSARAKGIRAAE